MSPMLKKIALGTGGLLGLLVALLVGIVAYFNLTFPANHDDTPRPDLTASKDPEVIARGQYLVDAVVHCTICHTPAEEFIGKDVAGMVPKGGHVWQMGPLGTVRSPNLTPAGIGDMSDADLARAIRTGIGADGYPAALMIAVGPMADEDVIAVMSYIRSLPPVDNDVPPTELSMMASPMLAMAMPGFMLPRDIEAPPFVQEGSISIERGRYIAEGPAFCFACHSSMDVSSNLTVSKPYFGGQAAADPDPHDSSMELMAPNLTSHPTGRTGIWDEETFVARMKAGRTVEPSPMPWENYQNMTEDDMRSIYRYLRSVPPIDRNTGPGYREAGWTLE